MDNMPALHTLEILTRPPSDFVFSSSNIWLKKKKKVKELLFPSAQVWNGPHQHYSGFFIGFVNDQERKWNSASHWPMSGWAYEELSLITFATVQHQEGGQTICSICINWRQTSCLHFTLNSFFWRGGGLFLTSDQVLPRILKADSL